MNELLFFSHIGIMLLFLRITLFGKKQALVTFICMNALFANLFVVKQISLFTLSVTASDVFVVGAILGANLLQEFYGKKEAKKAIYLSFFFLFMFFVFSKIHLAYAPSKEDQTHFAFSTLFSMTPRIIFSSILVFFLVQRIDVVFFSFLQKVFQQKNLGLRLFLSLTVSQFLDTLLFTYTALYGYVASFFHIVGFSFLVKMGVIALSSLFLSFYKKWIPEKVYVE